MNRLEGFQEKKKTAIYLSDISGAFDKVETELLLRKLRAAGLKDTFLKFFRSYLAPRRAIVLAEGEHSIALVLRDMIFQGTVLGPPLWNICFKDLDDYCFGGVPKQIADDLFVIQKYPQDKDNEEITIDLVERTMR